MSYYTLQCLLRPDLHFVMMRGSCPHKSPCGGAEEGCEPTLKSFIRLNKLNFLNHGHIVSGQLVMREPEGCQAMPRLRNMTCLPKASLTSTISSKLRCIRPRNKNIQHRLSTTLSVHLSHLHHHHHHHLCTLWWGVGLRGIREQLSSGLAKKEEV
ncbi:unnamed protein product [Linum trigynum]|uniref:Uncharacterized protein n=1 Tax=Linum trigynum TaxID=586398 RepID=A0AAV2DAC7_9ROSI